MVEVEKENEEDKEVVPVVQKYLKPVANLINTIAVLQVVITNHKFEKSLAYVK